MARRNRKKNHLRELTLHRIREDRRLKRLSIKYDPDKLPGSQHALKLNKQFQQTAPTLGKTTITLPKRMNFGDDIDETIAVIDKYTRK